LISETARREPWLFGDDYTHKINIAVSERYQLLPYIYTLFYHSSKTGEPVNRPIWFEFPEDKNSFGRDDVFLLGDGLLVSCVSQAGLRGQQALLLPGTANDVILWFFF
jgi:alpha 1,3-glucosidase